MEENSDDEVIKRLDVLISLNLKQQGELPVTKNSMTSIVKLLYEAGIDDYITISKIIGAKNPGSVANIISKLKKTSK